MPTPCFLPLVLALLVLLLPSFVIGLNADGTLLLSFKYSVLDDPLSVLQDWNYDDDGNPCLWNGVICTTAMISTSSNDGDARVVGLLLPNAQLVGTVASDLGLVEHLRHLDLSGNYLNGTLPSTLFNNAFELRFLSLARNKISGEIPTTSPSTMKSIRVLNLSDNALTGGVPEFEWVEVLDLSSNLLNGSLPEILGGGRTRLLNLSHNMISGEIPRDKGSRIPTNATLDLSFNSLTGEIPDSEPFRSQNPQSFAGNPNLCGRPLKQLCSLDSNPVPNVYQESPPPSPTSPPAIAVIPGNSPANRAHEQEGRSGMTPATIVAIIVGDLVGIGLLFILFVYMYYAKRKNRQQEEMRVIAPKKIAKTVGDDSEHLRSEAREPRTLSCSWRNTCGCCIGSEEMTGSSDTDIEEEEEEEKSEQQKKEVGMLVMVDGETEMELETLLGASAYILGAAESSIVYKAVLENGTAFAVRRIGERIRSGKLKDFEAQVRSIAKLRHPNLLHIHGFYWGTEEKLLIYDYAPNGSLSNISFTKKLGASPHQLTWDTRLRIARGVARGLAFLHDKKCVHGNLKSSNILLSADMEPWIADFGLDRLMSGGHKSGRPDSSARSFGSKRSAMDQPPIGGATPSPGVSSSALYQAPESLQSLKPSSKWDVFSFGMVVLELIGGRVFSEAEISEWNAGFVEEGRRVVQMADPAIRGEVQGKEDDLLSCFRLGFSCASSTPQRRPQMKEALQVIERILGSTSP